MEPAKPFDTLNNAKGKRVVVEIKNGKQYVGKLKAFDQHINVVLEEAEEYNNGEMVKKLGVVFLRGDTIILINPE